LRRGCLRVSHMERLIAALRSMTSKRDDLTLDTKTRPGRTCSATR
jgi:hypothetical protein